MGLVDELRPSANSFDAFFYFKLRHSPKERYRISSMTHNHDHGHDGHGHCHDEMHDHDHDHPSETGLSDDLFSHIDTQNVTALNVNNEEPVSKIFKPWHERYDETTVITAITFVVE